MCLTSQTHVQRAAPPGPLQRGSPANHLGSTPPASSGSQVSVSGGHEGHLPGPPSRNGSSSRALAIGTQRV